MWRSTGLRMMLAIGRMMHVNTPLAAVVSNPPIIPVYITLATTPITIIANDVKYSLLAREVNLSFTFDLRVRVFIVNNNCINDGNISHHLLMPVNQMIAMATKAASSTTRSMEA